MKEFHFSKTYFNKLICKDDNVRVVIKETPSIQISEEDYSLRIETRHFQDKHVHRNYAIEHHKGQKHSYPHLQFKFHTEEIGTFRIQLDFKNEEEYKRAILGFIYKIKGILRDLEDHRKGITKEMLVLDLVNQLSQKGVFLNQKIYESLVNYQIEFQNYGYTRDKAQRIEKNPLLLDFLGKRNINKIVDVYSEKK